MRERLIWSFDDCEVDLAAWRVSKAGRQLAIEPKGVALLALLVERCGDVVTKAEILDEVWKDATVTENAMVRVIGHLRTALGDDAKEPRFIETVHTRGYRFISPVTSRTVTRPDDAVPVVATTPVDGRAAHGVHAAKSTLDRAPVEEVSVSDVSMSTGTRRWRLAIGGIAVAVAAVLLLLFAIRSRDRPAGVASHADSEIDAAQASPKPSLAVLPLENLGPPDRQYFAGGMTEALTTQLGKIENLLVISRSAVLQYRHDRPPPTEIARELGVRYLVEGSALLLEDRVRISAYLVEGDTGRQLWAEDYEGALADVLALQSEVAREIAREVRARVTPEEADRLTVRRAVKPAAYDEYLWGLYYRQQSLAAVEGNAGSIRRAIAHFEAAATLQPDWAEAHGALAAAFGDLSSRTDDYATRLIAWERARESAERALELDPRLASAHRTLAWTLDLRNGDWEGAARRLREALRLEPNTADFTFSNFLAAGGRFDENLAFLRIAQERWPTNPAIPRNIGRSEICAGRLAEAGIELRQMQTRFPDRAETKLLEAALLTARGRFAEALDLLERDRAALLGARATSFLQELAYDAAKAGQPEQARQAIEELQALGGRPPPWVLFALGDLDAAKREIADRYEQRDITVRLARCWPEHDQMSRHPEIGPILREIGPPSEW